MRPHKRLVIKDRASRKTLISTSYDAKEFPAQTIRAAMTRTAKRMKVPEEELQVTIKVEWIFY